MLVSMYQKSKQESNLS